VQADGPFCPDPGGSDSRAQPSPCGPGHPDRSWNPTEVPLGASDGMSTDCVMTLDNVTLVRVALCTDRITRLGDERMQEVCEALRIATDC